MTETQTQLKITERTYQHGLHILAYVDRLAHDEIVRIVKETNKQIDYRLDVRNLEITVRQRSVDNIFHIGTTYDVTIKGEEEQIDNFVKYANYYLKDLITAEELQKEKK